MSIPVLHGQAYDLAAVNRLIGEKFSFLTIHIRRAEILLLGVGLKTKRRSQRKMFLLLGITKKSSSRLESLTVAAVMRLIS